MDRAKPSVKVVGVGILLPNIVSKPEPFRSPQVGCVLEMIIYMPMNLRPAVCVRDLDTDYTMEW